MPESGNHASTYSYVRSGNTRGQPRHPSIPPIRGYVAVHRRNSGAAHFSAAGLTSATAWDVNKSRDLMNVAN